MTAVKQFDHTDHLPAPAAAVTPMEMLDRAVANGASIETLEKLMGLQERWEANQGRKAFDAAMSEAKAEIGPILKNRKVDFTSAKGRTNYAYEDLAQIANTINPILAKHGLSYRYNTTQDGNNVTVTCIVSHRDGYSERNSLTAAADNSGNKNSIQAIGSTVTFLQRYTLKAAAGLAVSNDDDGRSAEPVKAINEEQLTELEEALVGRDVHAFMKYMKIDALSDLPANKFQMAMELIKRAKKNG